MYCCTTGEDRNSSEVLGQAVWSRPSTEANEVCHVHSSLASSARATDRALHAQFPMCFSDGFCFTQGHGSLQTSILFYFTYKSAAEHELKIHSKRMQLLFGLQLNAEKILFWQDFHLLQCVGLGLMVCCLSAKQ